jgi:hypothetical protein
MPVPVRTVSPSPGYLSQRQGEGQNDRGMNAFKLETELLRRGLQLFEARMDTKLAELEADLLDKMNEQTKTLFRTFLVTNSAMVLAVAALAFGAARLA